MIASYRILLFKNGTYEYRNPKLPENYILSLTSSFQIPYG